MSDGYHVTSGQRLHVSKLFTVFSFRLNPNAFNFPGLCVKRVISFYISIEINLCARYL